MSAMPFSGDSSSVPAASQAGLVDALGCARNDLHESREIRRPDLTFYRKRLTDTEISRVATPASDRGFLVGISMSTQHRRSIFSGRQGRRHDFEQGAIYIRDFTEDYRADIHGGFDFLLVEFSRAFFERFAQEHGEACGAGLTPVTAERDPVLAHLARAVAPVLEKPEEAPAAFVDQIGTAFGTYLLHRYGRSDNAMPSLAMRGSKLSAVHEARAKDMLLAKVKGNVSIPEIARECNMSASYFLRAFKESTGQTPHQWLLSQRVQMARDFLRSTDMPLADIAIACNFCDQSHFSRVFSQQVGTSPGSWRRKARN